MALTILKLLLKRVASESKNANTGLIRQAMNILIFFMIFPEYSPRSDIKTYSVGNNMLNAVFNRKHVSMFCRTCGIAENIP